MFSFFGRVFFLMFFSLKQSGIHTGNPWPPYKERTPLHPCYKGLIKLLHCKTLHIVIFTLLYKVTFSTITSEQHLHLSSVHAILNCYKI